MKARVKSIGEISTLGKRYGSEPDQTGKNEYLKNSNLNINFDIDIDSTPNIDWEQRRYELSKTTLAGMCAHVGVMNVDQDVKLALQYVDELIKQLKNK